MNKKAAAYVLWLLAGALLLRAALVGICLPEGVLLEQLARLVQTGEASVTEAVTAFCQGMIDAAS